MYVYMYVFSQYTSYFENYVIIDTYTASFFCNPAIFTCKLIL